MPARRSGFVPAVVATLALLGGASGSFAQEWAGTGRLSGVVLDDAGEPVAGARVQLFPGDQPQAGPRLLETDESGRWSYLGLAAGTWNARVEADGFEVAMSSAEVEAFGIGSTLRTTLRTVPEEQLQAEAAAAAQLRLQAADMKLAGGDFEEARLAYEETIADLEGSERARAWLQIAKTWDGEENTDEAIAALQQGLAVDPEHAESLELLSNLLIAQGREAEAEAYMARLPETVVLDEAAYLNVGIHHYNSGDLDAALKQFERVVESYPESAAGYFYRGVVRLSRGERELAGTDFVDALKLEPRGEHAADARKYLEYLE